MARTLGPYELLRPLAQGGMAEVFVARRVAGGVEKRLVIKRIRRERASDPRFVAMFVEEARLSMALVHRNIVPVFDFGRAGHELFLAMELVDGPDLGAILARARERGARLDPMLVTYIGLEACQALDYAHHATAPDGTPRPLVHRDVTPRNVLVSRAGEVKLVDFGVAASSAGMDADTGAGKVRGTPAYMAPEQARGEPVDGRADVFALGMVMWEALAGRRAYEGSRPHELLAQARAGQVPRLPGDAPGGLRSIVSRATAADPEDRYPGARAMQLALDEYLLAARAAAGSAPPGHALAAWIEEHFAHEPRLTGRGVEAPDGAVDDAPSGPVVTFLDDGAGSVLGEHGRETARSLAETVAETALASTMDAPARGSGEAPRDPTPPAGAAPAAPARVRGRRAWLLVAGAAGLTAIVVTALPGRPPAPAGPTASGGPAVSATAPAASPPADPRPATPRSTARPAAARPAAARPEAAEATPDAGNARATPAAAGPAAGTEDAAGTRSTGRPSPRAATTRKDRSPAPASSPGAGRRPAPGAPALAPGVVKISATPWARVTVAGAGASCDETPCVLQLPPGKHTLRLVNPVAGLATERVIELAPGETIVVRETLAP